MLSLKRRRVGTTVMKRRHIIKCGWSWFRFNEWELRCRLFYAKQFQQCIPRIGLSTRTYYGHGRQTVLYSIKVFSGSFTGITAACWTIIWSPSPTPIHRLLTSQFAPPQRNIYRLYFCWSWYRDFKRFPRQRTLTTCMATQVRHVTKTATACSHCSTRTWHLELRLDFFPNQVWNHTSLSDAWPGCFFKRFSEPLGALPQSTMLGKSLKKVLFHTAARVWSTCMLAPGVACRCQQTAGYRRVSRDLSKWSTSHTFVCRQARCKYRR